MCNCQLCTEHREIVAILKRGRVNELKRTVKRLEIALDNERADNNYHQAILDGSWDSAEEILRNSIKKAKAHRRAEAAKERQEMRELFKKQTTKN